MAKQPIVLILAAGLGTRMKTKRAKVLHEVAGRPLIAWAVEAALGAEARRIVAILGHQHEDVKECLDARYGEGRVEVALQLEQKGTGHAVQCALESIANEDGDQVVAVITGDCPLFSGERIRELVAACHESPAAMSLVSLRPNRPLPYGRLVRDESGTLVRIVEHRDATEAEREIDEMNAGFYAVKLEHLRAGIGGLTTDNAQGEFYLTDLAAHAAARGGAAVIEADLEDTYGINDRSDLAHVTSIAQRRINDGWMRAGVTMISPENTYIDADAGPIASDVTLFPGVFLHGRTRIGEGATVGPGCVLTNAEVGARAYLKPYSVLTDSKFGANVQTGPFTHCRPGTRVDEGAKLGNFVETKKTHLMAGAKASHLTYLGDASVGVKANVGAGTITCNYDGFSKFKTTIEAGAFIGSNSELVAPVTVGRDAYVGAGTTVTKDVPRSSLAISRVKQVNVEGWADRFRAAQSKRGK